MSPSASKLVSIPLWRPSSAHVARERRLEPEVVERRRAQLAGQGEQLLHRLVGERPDLGQLAGELRRRLLARRLEAQQQAGERLVDLVVQVARDPGALLLLGGERGARGPAALGLEPLEHADERLVQALDLLRAARGTSPSSRLAPGRERSARSIWSTRSSSGLNRRCSRKTLKRIVNAIAKPSTSAASGVSRGRPSGFAATIAATTAATTSSRFTTRTWVIRSRRRIGPKYRRPGGGRIPTAAGSSPEQKGCIP